MTPFRAFGAATLFLCMFIRGEATCTAQDQPVDSPLNKANVGDWVEFKGNVRGVEILGKRTGGTTATIRYTVKSKTDAEAILTIKSWAGEHEVGERELKVPFDKPIDAGIFAPTSDDKVSMKLVETFRDKKYKVGQKEFPGTSYKYKMSIDLFGGLVPGGKEDEKEKPKDKGKGMEMTVSIFVSPEAPVLGMVAMGMSGLQSVKYELSDGTGVTSLLYPPVPPKPTRAALASIGDWLEYKGKNTIDGREVVLRHTVVAKEMQKILDDKDGKEEPAIMVEAKLSVDGTEVETWEFVAPKHSAVTAVPRWNDWGYTGDYQSLQRHNQDKHTPVRVLDGKWIDAWFTELLQLSVEIEGKKQVIYVEEGINDEIPLTGIASFRLTRHNVVDVQLDLADHCGCVTITKTVPAPKTKEEKEAIRKSRAEAAEKKKQRDAEKKEKLKTKPKGKAKTSAKSK